MYHPSDVDLLSTRWISPASWRTFDKYRHTRALQPRLISLHLSLSLTSILPLDCAFFIFLVLSFSLALSLFPSFWPIPSTHRLSLCLCISSARLISFTLFAARRPPSWSSSSLSFADYVGSHDSDELPKFPVCRTDVTASGELKRTN